MTTRKRDRKPPRHTDNEVRKLVAAALKAGWAVEHPGSHAWGWLCCGGLDPAPSECRIVVKSTPRGDSQAKIVRRKLARCPHGHSVS